LRLPARRGGKALSLRFVDHSQRRLISSVARGGDRPQRRPLTSRLSRDLSPRDQSLPVNPRVGIYEPHELQSGGARGSPGRAGARTSPGRPRGLAGCEVAPDAAAAADSRRGQRRAPRRRRRECRRSRTGRRVLAAAHSLCVPLDDPMPPPSIHPLARETGHLRDHGDGGDLRVRVDEAARPGGGNRAPCFTRR
jgi:hypothetical protein